MGVVCPEAFRELSNGFFTSCLMDLPKVVKDLSMVACTEKSVIVVSDL